jgi:hypothetical protein
MKITERIVVSQSPETVKINFDSIPKHVMDSYCRVVIRGVTELFKKPETAADYEQWLIKRYGKREGKRRFKSEATRLESMVDTSANDGSDTD